MDTREKVSELENLIPEEIQSKIIKAGWTYAWKGAIVGATMFPLIIRHVLGYELPEVTDVIGNNNYSYMGDIFVQMFPGVILGTFFGLHTGLAYTARREARNNPDIGEEIIEWEDLTHPPM